MDSTEVVARLEAERERVLALAASSRADVAAMVEASRDSNADDEHDPEGQTIAYERQQLEALGSSARRRLAEVDAALQRVADGTYGVCEVCGRPIPDERLEARPTATRCVQHAG
ncbi:TraR/DksA family transcriptional regulator [Lapillicoccus jejuensis]|uniref:TraR/DksA family transcriptional regulator n=1 Tax=Lapillicoccus jejuensis TaxID=402171 RepID=A0A542E535_9MICO|nr:TraR/DksA family transcriptional regulator [Lapillicoccus jejuensis]